MILWNSIGLKPCLKKQGFLYARNPIIKGINADGLRRWRFFMPENRSEKMNIRWKRLTKADVERLTVACKLTETERIMLEMLQQGVISDFIAHEINYSRRQMFRLSKKLAEKISKGL